MEKGKGQRQKYLEKERRTERTRHSFNKEMIDKKNIQNKRQQDLKNRKDKNCPSETQHKTKQVCFMMNNL